MASQGPAPSSEPPKRLPLLVPPTNRDESVDKDARLINMFAEKDPATGEWNVEKRPGLSAPLYTLLDGSPTQGVGRGMYLWQIAGIKTTSTAIDNPPTEYIDVTTPWSQQILLVMSGINLYYVYLNAGVPVTQVVTGWGAFDLLHPTSGSKYWFQPINNNIYGSDPLIVVGNGKEAYVLKWTDSTKTLSYFSKIAYSSIPIWGVSALVPGFALLDGTTYMMDVTGKIQGSDINDPATYPAPNVIRAQIFPDGGVCLAKQLNYVVALKQWSTEFFYDNGNTTGSPLSPLVGSVLPYGCISADTVQELDGELFWVAVQRTGSPQVIRVANLQHVFVSTPAIERLLEGNGTTGYSSFVFKHGGHAFYGINLLTTNVTIVYDITQGLWYEWEDTNGNVWPIVSHALDLTGVRLLQDASGGNVYITEGDYTYPNDNGQLIDADIYTPNYDGKIDRRKTIVVMRFNGDQTTGSILQVRCSDDDYQTWTNFRTVNLGTKRPILTNCGTFYRRAYHFHHRCNTPIRIRSIDMQLLLGTL